MRDQRVQRDPRPDREDQRERAAQRVVGDALHRMEENYTAATITGRYGFKFGMDADNYDGGYQSTLAACSFTGWRHNDRVNGLFCDLHGESNCGPFDNSRTEGPWRGFKNFP